MKNKKILTVILTVLAALSCACALAACGSYRGQHEIPGIHANAVFDIKTDRLSFARGMQIDPIDVIVNCGCTLVDSEGNEVEVTRRHLTDGTVKYEKFDLETAGSEKRIAITYKKAVGYIFYDVNDYTVNFYLDEGKQTLWKSAPASAALTDTLDLSVWVGLDDYNYSTDTAARAENEERAMRFDGWYDDEGNPVTGVRPLSRTQGGGASVDLHARFLSQEERSALRLSYDRSGRRIFSGYTGERTETVRIPEGVTFVDLHSIFSSTPQPTAINFAKLHVPSTARFEFPLSRRVNTTGLEAVTVDGGNAAYASYKGAVYSKDYKTLYFMPASSLMNDFHDELEEFATYSCAYWQINTLVIPDSVTTLQNYCFAYSLLSDVSGFENVKSIMSGVFVGTQLSIDDGVALYNEESEGRYTLSMIVDKSISSYALKEGTVNIAGDAFARCENLVSVQLGDKLESIGASAFSGCVSLRSITLPSTLVSFGSAVFYGCKSLERVEGFENVNWQDGRSVQEMRTVPEMFFYGCESLSQIELPSDLRAIGAGAFQHCRALTALELPETLKEIGASAFHSSGLQSVRLPAAIESLGSAAFYGSQLTSIDLSHCTLLTQLSDRCFQECNLTSVVIPEHIDVIPEYCFYYIESLESVSLGNATEVGERAFSRCSALKNIAWSDRLVSIGERAFSYCYALEEITLPDSVETVYGYAFQRCDALKKITLGKGVEVFGVYSYLSDGVSFNDAKLALYQCNNLEEIAVSEENAVYRAVEGVLYGKSVCGEEYSEGAVLYSVPSARVQTELTLPASVKIVLPYAFQYQKSVTALTLNEGLENIGKGAFYSSTSLTELHLPSTVRQIGAGILLSSKIRSFSIDEHNPVFSSDGNLIYSGDKLMIYVGISPDVVIRAGTVEIESGVFMNNAQITSLVIPDSVTTIGAKAFTNCTKLTSITIGSGLQNLDPTAFAELPALQTITVSENNPYLKAKDNVLYSKDGKKVLLCAARNQITDLSFLSGVTHIGDYAFAHHATLAGIRLPEGVKTVGNYAFYECRQAAYFIACESLESIGERAFSFAKSIDTASSTETRYCDTLKFVLFYGNLKSIGAYAFYGQYGIEASYFHMSHTDVAALIENSGTNREYFLYGCPAGATGTYYNNIKRYLYRATEPDNLTVNYDGYGWFRLDENNLPQPW